MLRWLGLGSMQIGLENMQMEILGGTLRGASFLWIFIGRGGVEE